MIVYIIEVINTTKLMLQLNIIIIATGINATTPLNTIASKTDKLCLTTCVSFSQSSFGHHKFIIKPETALIDKNKIEIPKITSPEITLFNIIANIIDDIKIAGVITISGMHSFDKNT